MDDFVVQTNTLETGSVEIFEPGLGMVEPLLFNRTLLENTSRPTRDYQGSVLQARYRILENLLVEGHGRTSSTTRATTKVKRGRASAARTTPCTPSCSTSATSPSGDSTSTRRIGSGVWSIYTLGLGRFGDLSGSLLFNYDTGTAYDHSTRFDVTDTQAALGTGYASLPTQPTLWFGEKGAATFPRLLVVRFRAALRPSDLQGPRSLHQGRRVQRLQRPQADRVEYHGCCTARATRGSLRAIRSTSWATATASRCSERTTPGSRPPQ